MKVIEKRTIPNTGGIPYVEVGFIYGGAPYRAMIFPTPGHIVVEQQLRGGGGQMATAAEFEQKLRVAIGEKNPKTFEQTTFERGAARWGVPKEWFGQTIVIPNRGRSFTARYTVEALFKNQAGKVMVGLKTGRGKTRAMAPKRVREHLSRAGNAVPERTGGRALQL